eukprot:CAMPEP_0179123354 /NCGR_PEP_ID=MMETSP0796-20121207/58254_1 /TAXON_ID=73915 /ORGANISM="Pyrodinium bahamense, Strain pbaha01" /LENGTH=268 /DNA_ID=CAMNT_0020821997 /DNA_START=190 /DNA_END=996 /DNA_ORIENTATION=+
MGYGSLFNLASRVRTVCHLDGMSASVVGNLMNIMELGAFTPKAGSCIEKVSNSEMLPVKVKGVRRGWYSRGLRIADPAPVGWDKQMLDLAPTYLGAVLDPSSSANAVVYPVTEEELRDTDAREAASTVEPAFLNAADVQALNPANALPANAKIRWYPMAQDMVQLPTATFPIAQSYVDLVLSGALQLEAKHNVTGFARDTVLSTFGWSRHWVNDRNEPYRPFAQRRMANSIVQTLVDAVRLASNASESAEEPHKQPLTLQIMESITFP